MNTMIDVLRNCSNAILSVCQGLRYAGVTRKQEAQDILAELTRGERESRLGLGNDRALEEGDQLLVSSHDPLKESVPDRIGRIRVVTDRRQLGDQILSRVRPQLTRPQIQSSAPPPDSAPRLPRSVKAAISDDVP